MTDMLMDMIEVSFHYKTEIDFSSPASGHRFSLRIQPKDNDRQKIKEFSWYAEPEGVIWDTSDGFGNKVLSGFIDPSHDYFRFGIEGKADVSPEPFTKGELLQVLFYPSSLTRPDKDLTDFYNALNRSAPHDDVLQRLQYFSHAVHDRMRYQRGSTSPKTTAAEAFKIGSGVCQDYTHILLALLRMDKIPCRYIAGLASDYGETHAWAEAWDGSRYCGIDPTRDKLIDYNYIAISYGRDFDDCSIDRGFFIGMCPGEQRINLKMEIPQ